MGKVTKLKEGSQHFGISKINRIKSKPPQALKGNVKLSSLANGDERKAANSYRLLGPSKRRNAPASEKVAAMHSRCNPIAPCAIAWIDHTAGIRKLSLVKSKVCM